jgi:hypothetical protein
MFGVGGAEEKKRVGKVEWRELGEGICSGE